MTNITIPPEAVEAAAWKVCTRWTCDKPCATCIKTAAASLRAGIAAWPGIDTGPNIYGRQNAIIHLPLPTENTSAET